MRNFLLTISPLSSLITAFIFLPVLGYTSNVFAQHSVRGGASDDQLSFGALVLHGPVIAPPANGANHPIGPPQFPATEWSYTGNLFDQDSPNLTLSDIVNVELNVKHLITPPPPEHGEGVNPSDLNFNLSFATPTKPIPIDGALIADTDTDRVPHPDLGHFDEGTAALLVDINANLVDIDSYILAAVGKHTEGNEDQNDFGKVVPNNNGDDYTYAGGSYIVGSSKGDLTLAIAVPEISLNEIETANIRLGSSDDPGSIIFDLQPALFFDLDGLGVGRIILSEQFPLVNLDSLLTGNTFIEIQTLDENITSMLMPLGTPEPSSAFVLLALGIIGTGSNLFVNRKH